MQWDTTSRGRGSSEAFAGVANSATANTVTAADYVDVVQHAVPAVRAQFIRRTYAHLAYAILGFAALEFALLNSPFADALVSTLTWSWLLTLGLFIGASWVADRWARSNVSQGMQYAGLALYVVAEAIIFLPLMYIAAYYSDPTVIPATGVLTGLLFLGLTAVAFTSRTDFSFLRGVIMLGSLLALGLIVASLLFGFTLGVIFSVAMVGLAATAILYSTSNILRHYRTDQHVAAALSLFAAVALMYFYILRILTSLRR